MKTSKAGVVLGACMTVVGGCYTTAIRAPQVPEESTYEHRQWFTVGGLARISDESGSECGGRGVANAESRLSGTDILIDVGLTVGGGLIGAAACPLPKNASDSDQAAYASCVTAAASVVPFLIGSRTVRYTCQGQQHAQALSPIPSVRDSMNHE